MFSEEEKKYLLDLARRSIKHCLQSGNFLRVEEKELPSEKLKEKRACFVTLRINGNLRGCIGHISHILPLYQEVIENAAAAAFDDPRFHPISENEADTVEIEISVLTAPEKLNFKTPEELLEKLRPGIDGVIIKHNHHCATFLPQVWDEFENTEQLLSSLCLKAELEEDCWQQPGLEVETYRAEILH